MIISCTYHAYFELEHLELSAKLNLLTGVLVDFVFDEQHINDFEHLQLDSQTVSFSYYQEDYEFDIEMDVNKIYTISDFNDLPFFRQIQLNKVLEKDFENHKTSSPKIKL